MVRCLSSLHKRHISPTTQFLCSMAERAALRFSRMECNAPRLNGEKTRSARADISEAAFLDRLAASLMLHSALNPASTTWDGLSRGEMFSNMAGTALVSCIGLRKAEPPIMRHI